MDDEIKTTAEAAEAELMMRRHAVHLDPDAQTAEQQPLPSAVVEGQGEPKSPAQWAYERLVLYIQNFEKQLDKNHEVAMGFTGGDVGVMKIEGMGFFAPDIITFYGTDPAGTKTQQIQHVSQLNVMLRAVPKHVDQAEPNRIGFRLAEDLEKTKA